MPDRIANLIILAEDTEQQNLVRRYLERCGHNTSRNCRLVPLPAKASGGSGEKYVRDHFPEEVKACRSALGRRASALLVVMVDADMETTQQRNTQLSDALKTSGLDERRSDEPIVILIPKRHVETWIRALLGSQVDEDTDYKKPKPTPVEIREAARTLHVWTRPGIEPDLTSPPSLSSSLPEWKKIPS